MTIQRVKEKLSIAAIIMVFITVAACEKQGPAEELGENIDNSVEKISETSDNIANDLEDVCESASGTNC